MEVMQSCPPLDGRLTLAASFLRPGEPICDVGTDHAYLPLWLLLNGRIPFAAATDVHEAPLARARENAARWGCADRISFFLADGVADVPLGQLGIRQIMICGMGGELIARILENAPYTRAPGVRCILQPMSSAGDLRAALARDGYRIEDERIADAAGKLYPCLCVSYDGVIRSPSPVQILIGEANLSRGAAAGPVYAEYLRREARSVRKRRDGLAAGGHNTAEEDALLGALAAAAEKEGIIL